MPIDKDYEGMNVRFNTDTCTWEKVESSYGDRYEEIIKQLFKHLEEEDSMESKNTDRHDLTSILEMLDVINNAAYEANALIENHLDGSAELDDVKLRVRLDRINDEISFCYDVLEDM